VEGVIILYPITQEKEGPTAVLCFVYRAGDKGKREKGKSTLTSQGEGGETRPDVCRSGVSVPRKKGILYNRREDPPGPLAFLIRRERLLLLL